MTASADGVAIKDDAENRWSGPERVARQGVQSPGGARRQPHPVGVLKWGRAMARSIAVNGLAACCGTTLLPYGNFAMTDSAFVST
jgi:hypothetical protein